MKELGPYRLEEKLGRGATAQVFRATRPGASDSIALKVFHPGFDRDGEAGRRALAEIRASHRLKHPNILPIIDAHWDLDPPAVTMEYVDGVSLEKFQAQLPYVLPEISVLLVIEVLKALEHAHAQQIIHRDLKPANILIRKDGQVLVADFGLAKMEDFSQHTLTGTLLGSPDYMAPEQARGEKVSAQSDLFSVASILYFLVTGTRPFARPSPLMTLAAVMEGRFEMPHQRNPKVSAELSRIIAKGMRKAMDERFQSASEFRKSLEEYLSSIGLIITDDFQFKAWVKAPSEITTSALLAVAGHLKGSAENALSAQAEQDFHAAISHLSLVAPDSEAIAGLMDRFHQRKVRRRMFWWFWAGVAGLMAVSLGGYLLFRSESKEVPQVTVPAPVASVPVPARPEKSDINHTHHTAIVSRPVVHAGRVEFDIAEGVRVIWDGQEVDASRPLTNQKIGSHHLRLLRKGQSPIDAPVDVKASEPTVIRVR